jgi:hypothetical protein
MPSEFVDPMLDALERPNVAQVMLFGPSIKQGRPVENGEVLYGEAQFKCGIR